MIKGKWLGDERIINGVGVVKPGKVSLPKSLSIEFQAQGLFKPSPIKKTEATTDVRSNN